jgi:hypothetical protein
MPVAPTYPGVYIEEIPSGVRTIAGVATAVAAFIGRARRGPVDEPRLVSSLADYERTLGGLDVNSTMSYAVRDFHLNGGRQAIIVRIHNGSTNAAIEVGAGFKLEARDPGTWSNQLRVRVEHPPDSNATGYDLRIKDMTTGDEERFNDISVDSSDSRSLERVLTQSNLVRLSGAAPTTRPNKNDDVPPGSDPFSDAIPGNNSVAVTTPGADGTDPGDAQYTNGVPGTGIHAFRKLEGQGFNLLCIPPPGRNQEFTNYGNVLTAALSLCVERRAMLIVDPPASWTAQRRPAADLLSGAGNKLSNDIGPSGLAARNAVIYYPRVRQADPLRSNRVQTFVACGIVAGIMARTDTERGVWKAPAGLEATLKGIREPEVNLTDLENGTLNQVGINCLRTFPGTGSVVWGARTLRGSDLLADEYRYVRSGGWRCSSRRACTVAPSGSSSSRTTSRSGPRSASTSGPSCRGCSARAPSRVPPRDAYFVKCDKETTTPTATLGPWLLNSPWNEW